MMPPDDVCYRVARVALVLEGEVLFQVSFDGLAWLRPIAVTYYASQHSLQRATGLRSLDLRSTESVHILRARVLQQTGRRGRYQCLEPF